MTQNRINKKIFIVITLFFFVTIGFGQKTEVNFNAYSGLFSFYGNGSATNSTISNNGAYSYPKTYTSNVYGKKSGFSYAFEIQAQKVSARKNIIGLGLSFENLTSKVNIDTVTENGIIYREYSAKGKTLLQNTFVTLNPFIGHRYLYRNITFDLLAGFDLGFGLKSKEEGNALATDKNYSLKANNDRLNPSIDFRPRLQIKVQYHKFGFLLGYSLGVTNYQTQPNSKAYSQLLRAGVGYQLK